MNVRTLGYRVTHAIPTRSDDSSLKLGGRLRYSFSQQLHTSKVKIRAVRTIFNVLHSSIFIYKKNIFRLDSLFFWIFVFMFSKKVGLGSYLFQLPTLQRTGLFDVGCGGHAPDAGRWPGGGVGRAWPLRVGVRYGLTCLCAVVVAFLCVSGFWARWLIFG